MTALSSFMATALDAQRIPKLRPQRGQYARLREALARYRALAVDGSLCLVAMALAVPAKRGATECDGAALHRLLVALGEVAADATAPVDCNDPTLVGGLKRFQSRHGVASDGVIGKATLLGLNAPLPPLDCAARVGARASALAAGPGYPALPRDQHPDVPPMGLGSRRA